MPKTASLTATQPPASPHGFQPWARSAGSRAILALALGATAPAWAEDQSAVAIYQHLVETSPGQFELRALSLSVAAGPAATASVATISDAGGQLHRGISFATAGPDVGSLSQLVIDTPVGWVVDREDGSNVQRPNPSQD